MQVFHRLEDVGLDFASTSVAIGNFDGVHLGHQKLLGSLLAKAKQLETIPCVLSFFPHPVEVLNPGVKLERLTTASEKLQLLEQLGIQFALIAPFDAQLAALAPADFLQTYLAEGLKCRSVHVGNNFRFGKDRVGDISLLTKWGMSHQVELCVESPLELSGERVSSSRVRALIRAGQVQSARELLGRPYLLTGQVVQGEGRGRELGYPTANMRVASDKLLPASGVYLTRALWQKQSFLSLTNVGVKPTFHSGERVPTVEVHLLDFGSKLYDEAIDLQFYERVRSEMKFASAEHLREQIRKDVEWALQYTKFSN